LGAGVIARDHPDTYRLTALSPSGEQRLRAALAWAGPGAGAGGRSAGELHKLEGVRTPKPEIIVPRQVRLRSERIIVHRTDDIPALMWRTVRGIRVSGVEATLVALGKALEAEAFEIACEDARRRRLTSVPALRRYLERFPGRVGALAMHKLLDELDPVHPSRSTLEVKTRRLLVANGFTDFVREFPLVWNGRTYFFDFCFERRRLILETNGKRWHDDPRDYEDDNEKRSIPARRGYRIVFATWQKVTQQPHELLDEIATTLAA
jgi:very-short-patch-repair endonuclease